MSRGYRQDIEGLRAVAILMVMAFHVGIPGFAGGFLGVDVFFVISGYLITSLLTREVEQTGKINLLGFYARRARRLLPASALMLASTLLAATLLLSPVEQEKITKTALATAIYVSNFFFIGEAANYFAPDVKNNPLLHTWSLAVEEQFYLVWPAFIAAMFTFANRRGLIIACVVISVLSYAAWHSFSAPWAFFGTPARAWEFSIGALASFASASFLSRLRDTAWSIVRLLGLTAVVAAGALAQSPGPVTLIAVLGSAMVLIAGAAKPDGLLLNSPPMQLIGRLSYGWYLWHWPILVFAKLLIPSITLPQQMLCAGLALVVAAVSYATVENPIRASLWLKARPAYSMMLAALLTTATVGLTFGGYYAAHWQLSDPKYKTILDTVSEYSQFSERPCLYPTDVPTECEFAHLDSSKTVVLFGDSLAAQWFEPLNTLSQKHNWRLVVIVKAACSVAMTPTKNYECTRWREAAIKRIVTIDPAVVITSTSLLYPRFVGIEPWKEGYRRTFSIFNAANIPTLLIPTTPEAGFDIPACVMRALRRGGESSSCDIPRPDPVLTQAQIDALAGLPMIKIININDALCDSANCPSMRNGILVYADATHITHAFARTLSGNLLEGINGIMTPD